MGSNCIIHDTQDRLSCAEGFLVDNLYDSIFQSIQKGRTVPLAMVQKISSGSSVLTTYYSEIYSFSPVSAKENRNNDGHQVPAKGKTYEGLNYSLDQEKYLKVFLEDGEVPMDNNAAEKSIRGFCIGRKNWVMIDTIAGAKSSAIIYSIAETAKADGLKPYEYFE